MTFDDIVASERQYRSTCDFLEGIFREKFCRNHFQDFTVWDDNDGTTWITIRSFGRCNEDDYDDFILKDFLALQDDIHETSR
jgi:hypothetical protein